MKKIILTLAIICTIFLVGCVEQEKTCEAPYSMIGESCCMDNNANNICDTQETTVVVSEPDSIEEVEDKIKVELDPKFQKLLDISNNIKSYQYTKKRFEAGSNRIEESYEVWKKGNNMRQEYAGNAYYIQDSKVYVYIQNKNQSTLTNSNVLKEDTLLSEFDKLENINIIHPSYGYEEIDAMLVNYTIGNDYYRAFIHKIYGYPLEIQINNEENKGTIIRYDNVAINKVQDSELTVPGKII